jgi:chemotaxis protein MotB
MAAGGGGAWKVAYADFVTAMMAFFLVMWITAQSKQMKQAVQHYFNDPFNSRSKSKGPESAGSTTTGPLDPGSRTVMLSTRPGTPAGVKPSNIPRPVGRKIQDIGPKAWAGEGNRSSGVGKPTIFSLNNGKDQSTGTLVTFADNSPELGDKAKDQLARIVPLLVGKRQKIEIRGHARQTRRADGGGGETDVWQLSYARAMMTMKYLTQAGIEPDRFRLSLAGSSEPRTIKQGTESQTLNSYIELMVLPELTDDYFGSREERDALGRSP